MRENSPKYSARFVKAIPSCIGREFERGKAHMKSERVLFWSRKGIWYSLLFQSCQCGLFHHKFGKFCSEDLPFEPESNVCHFAILLKFWPKSDSRHLLMWIERLGKPVMPKFYLYLAQILASYTSKSNVKFWLLQKCQFMGQRTNHRQV